MLKSKKYCMFVVKHGSSYKKRSEALNYIFELYEKASWAFSLHHTPENSKEEIRTERKKEELYKFLMDALHNNTDSDIREDILLHMNDRNLAAQVVFSDPSCFVRSAAIHIIHDNEVLYRVALNDSNNDIRIEAVRNIYDTGLLEKLREDNNPDDIRKAASRQLEFMEKNGFKTKTDKIMDDLDKKYS